MAGKNLTLNSFLFLSFHQVVAFPLISFTPNGALHNYMQCEKIPMMFKVNHDQSQETTISLTVFFDLRLHFITVQKPDNPTDEDRINQDGKSCPLL